MDLGYPPIGSRGLERGALALIASPFGHCATPRGAKL